MLFKMADRNVVTVLDIFVALALAGVLLLGNGCVAPESADVPMVRKGGIVATHSVRIVDREGLQAKLVSFVQNTKEMRSAHTRPDTDMAQGNNEIAEFDVYALQVEADLH